MAKKEESHKLERKETDFEMAMRLSSEWNADIMKLKQNLE